MDMPLEEIALQMLGADVQCTTKLHMQVRRRGQTSAYRYKVDWEDLQWSTFQNLGMPIPSPGPDEIILEASKVYLQGLKASGDTLFANPAFLVVAPANTLPKNFVAEARRAQRAFWHELKGNLLMPRRSVMRRVNGLHRQFAFNGVLVIKGRHIHPQHWPDQQRRCVQSSS